MDPLVILTYCRIWESTWYAQSHVVVPKNEDQKFKEHLFTQAVL